MIFFASLRLLILPHNPYQRIYIASLPLSFLDLLIIAFLTTHVLSLLYRHSPPPPRTHVCTITLFVLTYSTRQRAPL
jgi:hypothetical protein